MCSQELHKLSNQKFGTNRLTGMDTKKLRQKILDLAIHGKLVPQDPNDEPASVLLERIKAEKERLIKEGKIKRAKCLQRLLIRPIMSRCHLRCQVRGYGVHWEIWLLQKRPIRK